MAYDPEYWKIDPEYHRTCDFLGIDKFERINYELAKKISNLYDWAKAKSRSEDRTKIFSIIKEYKKKLSIKEEGLQSIDEFNQAIKLGLDIQKDKELEKRAEQRKEREKSERQAILKTVRDKVEQTLEKKKEDVKQIVEEPKQTKNYSLSYDYSGYSNLEYGNTLDG